MIRRPEPTDLNTTLTAVFETPAPEHLPAPARLRFLLLFKGRAGVQVAELGPGASKIVGRVAPAELIVEDASLSRQHARIAWQEQGVLVEDLGSKNGTHFAGAAVDRQLVMPGTEITLGNVVMSVRRAHDIERRGFDDYDRFLSRVDDELLRSRTLNRPLSLLMLRALPDDRAHSESWWLRVRAELRPIDTIAVYAPSLLLILLPELVPTEARFVAQALVSKHADEPTLVCGIATLQQSVNTAHELIAAASRACRGASVDKSVMLVDTRSSESVEPLIANAAMHEVYRLARRVASHAAPVLILGETGTGKELVARYTHDAGNRRDKPFRAINCGAIPANLVESVLFGHERGAFTGAHETRKGVFEDAHGGTLFLDEIGELPLSAQAALLRVLETKQLTRVGGNRAIDVDVRIVSATHCDIEAMLATNTFRADLYHRLNLMTLRVPPLRERVDEIEAFALRFLRSDDVALHTSAKNFSPAALDALRAYAWLGNVRELRNVIERAALLCDSATLEVDDLPERVRMQPRAAVPIADETSLPASGSFADLVRSYEVGLIRDALSRAGGNQTKAAELLDMPLRTLVYKIRSYGLRTNTGQNATN